MKTFTAQLRDIAKRRTEDMRKVAQASIQDTVADMQTPVAKGGRLPVSTGYLRSSLVSGLNGAFGPPSADGYVLTIAGLELGDVARFGYTADYSYFVEVGSRGRPGRHFMGSAAAKWPDTVARNAAKLR